MRLNGRFGRFGGCYVPEILVPALEQLEAAFLDAQDNSAFAEELNDLLANYAGRPTPLTRCRNLPGKSISSARICFTAAPTRPTRSWPRACSPSAWARPG